MQRSMFRHVGLMPIVVSAIGLAFVTVAASLASARASELQILYSFDRDHPYPVDIVDLKGSFYGVTQSTGTAHPGTFFRLSRDGSMITTLYVFEPGSRYVVNPGGGLLPLGDVIYGTTGSGGSSSDGYIYKMTRAGTKTILHTFDGRDGSEPFGLTNVDGTFYALTSFAGSGNGGTFFRLNPDGSGFQTLYAFKRDGGAAKEPTSPLAYLKGAFYGMSEGRSDDRGEVYNLTSDGRLTILHTIATNFSAFNSTRITPFHGLLYGTTFLDSSFDGAVFSMGIAGGGFKYVHRFKGAPNDGSNPAGLIKVGDKLYGVTFAGGKFDQGTIFSIDEGGNFSLLYSFPGYPAGAAPFKLSYVDGAFYGLTLHGGTKTGSPGVGTVFKFTP